MKKKNLIAISTVIIVVVSLFIYIQMNKSIPTTEVYNFFIKDVKNKNYNENLAKKTFNETATKKDFIHLAKYRISPDINIASKFKHSKNYKIFDSPEGIKIYSNKSFFNKNAFYLIQYRISFIESDSVKDQNAKTMKIIGDAIESKSLLKFYKKNFFNFHSTIFPYGAALLDSNVPFDKNSIVVEKVHDRNDKLLEDKTGCYFIADTFHKKELIKDPSSPTKKMKKYVNEYTIIISEQDYLNMKKFMLKNKKLTRYPLFTKLYAFPNITPKDAILFAFVKDSHHRETDVEKVITNIKGETSSMVGMK